MKASKMFLLCVALLVVGIMPVYAQSSKMKARMTQIRNEYAKAVKLAEAGLMGPRKNSRYW
jgi:Tfp pilus assembly protein PilX